MPLPRHPQVVEGTAMVINLAQRRSATVPQALVRTGRIGLQPDSSSRSGPAAVDASTSTCKALVSQSSPNCSLRSVRPVPFSFRYAILGEVITFAAAALAWASSGGWAAHAKHPRPPAARSPPIPTAMAALRHRYAKFAYEAAPTSPSRGCAVERRSHRRFPRRSGAWGRSVTRDRRERLRLVLPTLSRIQF
jgi:hypothetical protein